MRPLSGPSGIDRGQFGLKVPGELSLEHTPSGVPLSQATALHKILWMHTTIWSLEEQIRNQILWLSTFPGTTGLDTKSKLHPNQKRSKTIHPGGVPEEGEER